MPIVNEETRRKIFGDFPEEPVDGAYRLGATVLVKKLQVKALKQLRGQRSNDASRVAVQLLSGPLGEFFLGFVLASALEFLPLQSASDVRIRLAYNLRVRSWEDIGEKLLPFVGIMVEDVKDVMKNLPSS